MHIDCFSLRLISVSMCFWCLWMAKMMFDSGLKLELCVYAEALLQSKKFCLIFQQLKTKPPTLRPEKRRRLKTGCWKWERACFFIRYGEREKKAKSSSFGEFFYLNYNIILCARVCFFFLVQFLFLHRFLIKMILHISTHWKLISLGSVCVSVYALKIVTPYAERDGNNKWEPKSKE